MFFVQLLAQVLAPIALVLTLVCNIVRFYQTGPATDYNSDKDALDWLEILVLNPITSALPMVSLSFPLYWNVANYIALAKIMNDYLSFRHVHVTEDPFDDTPGKYSRVPNNRPVRLFRTFCYSKRKRRYCLSLLK